LEEAEPIGLLEWALVDEPEDEEDPTDYLD
jgi:hypothetical protein